MNKYEQKMISKAISVIKSCQTLEQVTSAKNFCILMARHLDSRYIEDPMYYYFLDKLEPFIDIKEMSVSGR